MADRRRQKTYEVYSALSGTAPNSRWTGLVAALPTAEERFHNFLATVVQAGVPDVTYRCRKQADGSYAWFQIAPAIIETSTMLDFGTREVAFS